MPSGLLKDTPAAVGQDSVVRPTACPPQSLPIGEVCPPFGGRRGGVSYARPDHPGCRGVGLTGRSCSGGWGSLPRLIPNWGQATKYASFERASDWVVTPVRSRFRETLEPFFRLSHSLEALLRRVFPLQD